MLGRGVPALFCTQPHPMHSRLRSIAIRRGPGMNANSESDVIMHIR